MDLTADIGDQNPRNWKSNIANILYRKNVCGICLKGSFELRSWDYICHIENGHKWTLKDVIECTLSSNIENLLPTANLCEECMNTILSSYILVKKIKSNHEILQKYFNIINEQIELGNQTKRPVEKQLMLTIDNVDSLNVPTTVTVTKKQQERENVTQILLCEPEFSETDNIVFKYECPFCGRKFNNYKSFKDHHSQHKDKFFRCYKCSKRFKIFDDFIQHRQNRHLDYLDTCEICKIILLDPNSIEHLVEHTDIFFCSFCNTTFNSEYEKTNHLCCNTYEVTCQHCLKTYPNNIKLDHHRCLFKCLECKDACIHETYLVSYREQHLANQTIFQCKECDFKYTTRSQLICHVNEEHLYHCPYLCDICGESFASQPYLTSHVNKKHVEISSIFQDKSVVKFNGPIVSSVLSERPYECDICGFCFSTAESYTTHRRVHLNDDTQCHLCDKSFNSIGKLNLHVKESHPSEINIKSAVYQCTMCPIDLKSRSEILEHVLTHPSGSKHICRECNQSFKLKSLYTSHVRKHKIKYDKQCPICLKKYTKYTIQRHMTLHMEAKTTDNSSIICDLCGISLSSEKALIKHSVKHKEMKQCSHCLQNVNSALYAKHIATHVSTEKPLKSCSDCDYTTRFAACLEAHVNRHHLKTRPYKCAVCNKTFYSEYTLKGHKATHQNERIPHFCHMCGKKFISKKAIILHMRLHTGETPYPCDLCDLSFLSASRRRQHMIRKHFEPSVECEICSKKLYTQSDLRRHIGDCHNGEHKRRTKKAEVASEHLIIEQEQELSL